jgi:hypothetical protein
MSLGLVMSKWLMGRKPGTLTRHGITPAPGGGPRLARQSLAGWLAKTWESGCAELRSSASGLLLDVAAVAAALTERWSNGPVEGAVNRLKLIKRSGRMGVAAGATPTCGVTGPAKLDDGRTELSAPTSRESLDCMPFTMPSRPGHLLRPLRPVDRE